MRIRDNAEPCHAHRREVLCAPCPPVTYLWDKFLPCELQRVQAKAVHMKTVRDSGHLMPI